MLPLHRLRLDNRLDDRLGNRLLGVFVFVIHHVVCPFQRTVVVVCVSHECIIPDTILAVNPTGTRWFVPK